MSVLALIEQDIYGLRERFDTLLVDRSINFEREAGFAMQVIQASDYLQKVAMANRQSLVDAIVNVAAIGMSLNPAKKQCYLVPRKGKICLDLSYMGLMDLAVKAGAIKWAQAEAVFAADTFVINGVDKPPTHQYNPFSKDRGEFIGVYVVAKTPTGDYLTETMSADDIHSIRDRSEAWKAWIEKQKKCPWVTDFVEMARKTVVKRASKYWRENDQSGRLNQAIHLLNTDGEEGFVIDNAVPITGFDAVDWCNKAQECKDIESLKALWAQAGKAATEAKDRGGYALVRNAVNERREQLTVQA